MTQARLVIQTGLFTVEQAGFNEDDIRAVENYQREPIETVFERLLTMRSKSGYIPITAIWTAADRYGVGELFIQTILSLDRVYSEGHAGYGEE